MLKDGIKRVIKKEYLPLWIFALIQLVYHIWMTEPESSDAMWFFRNQLDAYSWKDYLTVRYHAWSSRLLIEGVLVWISRNIVLWKIVDWSFWVFLACALTGLFPKETPDGRNKTCRGTAAAVVVVILLMYPMWDLRTAGWIATSVNYVWPLAFGVFSLHGIVRIFYGEKTHPAMWILYGVAAVFGANMEQMSAVLLTVNFCAIVFLVLSKGTSSKDRRVLLSYAGPAMGFVIAAASFVFIMTCPGNALRKNQEIINWMPDFGTYHLLDKVSMGFVDTMHHLISSGNLIFLCYLLLLAVLVYQKTSRTAWRATALFPVIITVGIVFFGTMLSEKFPSFYQRMDAVNFIRGNNYQVAANYIPTMLYLAVIGCVMISLVMVCESWAELSGQLILLALGLATRVVMGFTPTIYVSQERTFFFCYMILLVSAGYLIQRNIERLHEMKSYESLKLAGVLLAVFGVVLNLTEIGSV